MKRNAAFIPTTRTLRLFSYVLWLWAGQALLSSATAAAQMRSADPAFRASVLQNAVKAYRNAMGDNLLLYNGAEYTGSYPGVAGHPYFLSGDLQPGAVYYEGVYYPDMLIKYDLVSNELVIKGKQNVQIVLPPEKIGHFYIGNHLFVKLTLDSGELAAPYFYEQLYKGRLTVWLKQRKQAERGFRAEDPYHFTQYNTYVIEKENRYITVDNEKALMALFGNEREAVRKYLRTQKQRFKKDPGQTIIKAVAYYDGLKK